MRIHLIRGLMLSLFVFILMMTWVASGLFMDYELPESPISFSVQRYWLFGWTIVSLVLSFIVMTISTVISVFISLILRHKEY